MNNKEIKIDNKPVYFKNYSEAGITYTHDVLFDRDINVAFTHLSNKIHKTNFLQLAGLRHSIPSLLRFANVPLSTLSSSFTFKNNTFDIRQKRSKDYYSLLVSRKAKHPNITVKLQRDFDFTIDQTRGGGGDTSLKEATGDVPLDGVAFSIELVEWAVHYLSFGVRQFFLFTVGKRTKMSVL